MTTLKTLNTNSKNSRTIQTNAGTKNAVST